MLPALAGAADPRFELPIRCTPGRDCFVQNHFDRDPGPAWRDYGCGHLAYDGHAGTDFRLTDRRRMQDGVEVLAAASGTVVGVRDGEPDVALYERESPLRPDRAAGNGVRIDHGDGWETQYSHLRRGSVRVRAGDRVAAGSVLGLVGLSGRTDFPHVDFTVRHHGRHLDPFAPDGDARCGSPRNALWSDATLAGLDYRPSGVLGGGFSTHRLSRGEIEAGDAYARSIDTGAALVFVQFEVFGIRVGDSEELTLSGPAGDLLARSAETQARQLAVRRVWLGKRRPGTQWPAGVYVAEYRLRRAGETVASARRELPIGAAAGVAPAPMLRDPASD